MPATKTKILRSAILAVTAILIIALAVGTFYERSSGHLAATTAVYHTGWFMALWGLLAAMGIVAIVRYRLWQRPWVFLLHISLLAILLGAFLSHLTSLQGSLHLRQGETASSFFPSQNDEASPLPFTLRLDSFRVDHNAGTQMPRDFHSYVTLQTQEGSEPYDIHMNHILSHGGYHFYQTSYDRDGQGTILTVTYDPIGLPVTYAAYALLGFTMMGTLCRKWLAKRRKRKAVAKIAIWGLVLLQGIPCLAARESIPTVNASRAAEMERFQVIGEERVMPLGTLSRDFLVSVYGKDTYRGLSATQVLIGWSTHPEAWKDQPMILIKDATLRERLGIKGGKYATFANLFNPDGSYRLDSLSANSHDEALQKAIIQLDEKVGLVLLATRGELVHSAPVDMQISEARVSAELVYNRLPQTKMLFIVCLTVGLCLFILAATRRMRFFARKPARYALLAILILPAAYHTALYALRWYISGHIPLGNGVETMLFMALLLLWIAVWQRHKNLPITASAVLMAGFTLLVAHLGEATPRIAGLMPVLQSPLLTLHVSVIMTAYALLGMTCLLSVMWWVKADETLTALSREILLPAVFLLSAGIFLGAVWAGVSWGSYWSWDPKEVWALITLLVYAAPLHAESLPIFTKPKTYHIYMVSAFVTVLFTYFGVNYLLGGMHSYA